MDPTYVAAVRLYVELIADKVRALGGDPWQVPATPDGDVSLPGAGQGGDVDPGKTDGGGASGDFRRRHCPLWLALLILLLILIILLLAG